VKNRAAVLFKSPGTWETVTLDLDEPGPGEVLVQMVASGLCHSQDHPATGDIPPLVLPLIGGDEGSGIVRAVGPEVTELAVGDHVVTSFVPSCGTCRWCARGWQHLCDNGAHFMRGSMPDGTYRNHLGGVDVASAASVGTFAEHQVVGERSVVKVPRDLPLDALALLACGAPTGWGSTTNAAEVGPGDTVVVMGCGGIGIHAVQGAVHTGAAHVVAVDPQPYKREMSLHVGATHAFEHIDEATELVASLTNGQGADAVVVATGVRTGEHIGQAFRATRKGGTVVVTGLGPLSEQSIPVDLVELSMYQKRIQGCLYGNAGPRDQIPRLVQLYRSGRLKLDELITTRYRLDDVEQGFADMRAGRNIRGVVDFGVDV
jgi:NDMA-dependent alcohol dehydrogenase